MIYSPGMDMTIGDWREKKFILHPCPVCGKDMQNTMSIGDFQVYECAADGCTGREVHGVQASKRT